MSGPELPGLGWAAAVVLVAAPFLLLALRSAARLLPARARPAHRWKGAEVVVVCLLPFALFQLLAAWLRSPDVFTGLLVNELVFALTGGLIVALAAAREQGLAGLGLGSSVPPHAYVVAPLVFVPWFFVAGGLEFAWAALCRARGWAEEQEVLLRVLELDGARLLAAALIAVLLGPLLEELLFRGFLQPVLAQALGERGGLVATSAVFAALHGVAGLPVLFGLSLFLGWLQLRSRCLWIPWSAHALHNAITLGLALALEGRAG